jgi:putative flippase GtrA
MPSAFLSLLPPVRAALLVQFLRFGTVGGLGFVVDTSVVYALRDDLGLYWARALSFLVVVTFTWALNRSWTFRGRGAPGLLRQWALFLGANSSGAALNLSTYFVLVATVPFCATNPVVAVAAGAIAGMFINFALSRQVVFGEHSKSSGVSVKREHR